MNAPKLKEIAHASPTAEMMFTSWAVRERHRSSTDPKRFRNALLKEKVPVNDEDFKKTFKALEDAGIGEFDSQGRFNWHYSVQAVGQFGLGEVAKIKRISKPKPGVKRFRAKPKVLTQSTFAIVVSVPGGRLVPVSLPKGLTQADYEAIGSAIQQLARLEQAA